MRSKIVVQPPQFGDFWGLLSEIFGQKIDFSKLPCRLALWARFIGQFWKIDFLVENTLKKTSNDQISEPVKFEPSLTKFERTVLLLSSFVGPVLEDGDHGRVFRVHQNFDPFATGLGFGFWDGFGAVGFESGDLVGFDGTSEDDNDRHIESECVLGDCELIRNWKHWSFGFDLYTLKLGGQVQFSSYLTQLKVNDRSDQGACKHLIVFIRSMSEKW